MSSPNPGELAKPNSTRSPYGRQGQCGPRGEPGVMASWISTRTGQFAYFDRQLQHPDWSGKKVLDFGGNVGNILLDPKCTIEPANYWSIDVSRDAIAEGRRRH